jgi:hypothetical protein
MIVQKMYSILLHCTVYTLRGVAEACAEDAEQMHIFRFSVYICTRLHFSSVRNFYIICTEDQKIPQTKIAADFSKLICKVDFSPLSN